MSPHDDLHRTILKVTARAMALEKLVLALIAQSPDKLRVLKAFEEEMDSHATRTLFESEMKDYPENDLPVAFDHLLAQLTAMCQ